jgi:hypothetical protein
MAYDANTGERLGELGRPDEHEMAITPPVSGLGDWILFQSPGWWRLITWQMNLSRLDETAYEYHYIGGGAIVTAALADGGFLTSTNGIRHDPSPGRNVWEETFVDDGWQVRMDSGHIGLSLAIDEAGIAYVGTVGGYVYAIDVRSPYAPTGWPTGSADAQGSFRSRWPAVEDPIPADEVP